MDVQFRFVGSAHPRAAVVVGGGGFCESPVRVATAVLTEVYVHVKQLSAVHAQPLKSPPITYASRVQSQWCERIV